jgi:ATP-dependent Lhr-like helicase
MSIQLVSENEGSQEDTSIDLPEISPKIVELIEARGWKKLTIVQEKAIQPIKHGNNVIIVAPTGYGKTEAALIPILSMMVEDGAEPVALLYITPLRALINDIYERVSWWAHQLGFRVARKHGDVPYAERAKRLRNAPHILITTPESLEIDLDWATRFREYYKNLKWVIVDEVHEIVGSRRGVQLAVLLERLRRFAGDFQLVLLSATIGDPETTAKAFTGSSKRPLTVVDVKAQKELSIVIDYVESGKTEFWRKAAEKLYEHMEPLTIVFVNSKYVAENLHRELEKKHGNKIVIHHASISAEERQRIEREAKKGGIDMIIATKTLELGIDIGYAKKVVLFRPTGHVSSLLQRLGRSGHTLHGTIKGAIIATDEIELIEALAEARLAAKGVVEPPEILHKPLDMAARAILGMSLTGAYTVDEAYDILKSVYYFRDLSKEEFDSLIKDLVEKRMIKIKENNVISAGTQFYRIWRFNPGESTYSWWVRSFSEFFTTMGEKKNYLVKTADGKVIGELDPDYVVQILRVGHVIRLGGKNWQVINIDEHNNRVIVIEAEHETASVPFWRGKGPEASEIVLREIERVIKELHNGSIVLPSNVKLTPEAEAKLTEIINEIKKYKYETPSSDKIIVEQVGQEYVFVTIAPIKALRALAYTLMVYAQRLNSNIYAKITHYGFSLPIVNGFDPVKLLLGMDRETFMEIAREAARRSPYLVEVAHNIQLLFGVTRKLRSTDGVVYQEALRQVLEEYFDISKAWEIVERLRTRKIRLIVSRTRSSFYARAIASESPERLWLGNIEEAIAEVLEGIAFTVEELADALSIPEDLVESRLKNMLKPNSHYRVFYFIDVDTGELRWALVKDAKTVATSEEFSSSFNPSVSDGLYLVLAKSENGTLIHVTVRLDELVENPESLVKQIPFNELYELKVVPLTGYYDGEPPRYHYVPREIAPYLVLNAIAYIQFIQMNNPIF